LAKNTKAKKAKKAPNRPRQPRKDPLLALAQAISELAAAIRQYADAIAPKAGALEKIDRGAKGIMDAIEDGMYQPALKARMEELVQQKAEIEARLAEAPADLPDVHPNIAEHYRAKVIRLAETLGEPESDVESQEDIRSLVGEVVITPGDKRGESHAILRGELMAILDLAAGHRRSPKPEVITNALACPCNHRHRRYLIATQLGSRKEAGLLFSCGNSRSRLVQV
jgi:hypothetical protein